jgi:hypothetical protein
VILETEKIVNANRFGKFLRDRLPALCSRENGEDAGYALPLSTLACLSAIVRELDVRTVFEFGSGRSTAEFLVSGCDLTSVENDPEWMDKTLATIPAEQRARLHSITQPLRIRWHRGVPFPGWNLSPQILARLGEAELVLVDSPVSPPFREHALLTCLRHVKCGLVVVDDANIPTVRRFCDRLARQNNLLGFYSPLDHGLYFFALESRRKSNTARSVLESLKAWRRFFLAPGVP